VLARVAIAPTIIVHDRVLDARVRDEPCQEVRRSIPVTIGPFPVAVAPDKLGLVARHQVDELAHRLGHEVLLHEAARLVREVNRVVPERKGRTAKVNDVERRDLLLNGGVARITHHSKRLW
jgi:hypothetical protein